MPCDVCASKGDNKPKEVYWCEACKAYICKSCAPRYGRRAMAAANRAIKMIKI